MSKVAFVTGAITSNSMTIVSINAESFFIILSFRYLSIINSKDSAL